MLGRLLNIGTQFRVGYSTLGRLPNVGQVTQRWVGYSTLGRLLNVG